MSLVPRANRRQLAGALAILASSLQFERDVTVGRGRETIYGTSKQTDPKELQNRTLHRSDSSNNETIARHQQRLARQNRVDGDVREADGCRTLRVEGMRNANCGRQICRKLQRIGCQWLRIW